jgi:ankyrin repeat protein
MDLLILNGAKIHALNQNSNTPLHSAAYGNQPAAIRSLLGHGADKKAKNKDGDTPLHSAAWKGSDLSIHELADESSIDEPNNERDTPLHLAAWNNQPSAVSALKLKNANLYARNDDGDTPADLAKKKKHEAVLLLLSSDIPTLEHTEVVPAGAGASASVVRI